jgi:hypothetical protein
MFSKTIKYRTLKHTESVTENLINWVTKQNFDALF